MHLIRFLKLADLKWSLNKKTAEVRLHVPGETAGEEVPNTAKDESMSLFLFFFFGL